MTKTEYAAAEGVAHVNASRLASQFQRVHAAQRVAQGLFAASPFVLPALPIVVWLLTSPKIHGEILDGSFFSRLAPFESVYTPAYFIGAIAAYGALVLIRALALTFSVRLVALLTLLAYPAIFYFAYGTFFGYAALGLVFGDFDPVVLFIVLLPLAYFIVPLFFFIRATLDIVLAGRAASDILRVNDRKTTVAANLALILGAGATLIPFPKRRTLNTIILFVASMLTGLAFAVVPVATVLAAAGMSTAFSSICVNVCEQDTSQITNFIAAPIPAAVLAIGSLFIAGALRRFANWRSRISLDEATRLDTRAPVLFLRSFADDQVRLPRKSRGPVEFLSGAGMGRETIDTMLVQEFSWVGPVVAIGRPGDKSLPFGAARVYVSDDRWQAEVEELATRACAIVIAVSNTGGLAWELSMIQRLGLERKAIFLSQPALADLKGEQNLWRDWLKTNGLIVERAAEDKAQRKLALGRRVIAYFAGGQTGKTVLTTKRANSHAYRLALRSKLRREFSNEIPG